MIFFSGFLEPLFAEIVGVLARRVLVTLLVCEFNESNVTVTDFDTWGNYAGFVDSDFDFRFMISMFSSCPWITGSMVKVFG